MDDSILPAVCSANKLFLSGPFGSGKTTLAIERIRWLLRQERVRGDDILVLVPQRTLGQPYQSALRGVGAPFGAPVRITTLAGLARQSVELYWPLLAAGGPFQEPHREPAFLNLESAQYHMAPLVDEAIDAGDFDGIRVERNRIVSQVLDNMNKAALHGFTIDDAYARLELAVAPGEHHAAQINALRAARRISHAFRDQCLRNTLLDFSLQIELFDTQVLTHDWSRTHLLRSCRHLIADNLEEDTAAAHKLLAAWLPSLDTALLLVDTDAGHRVFLGADPAGALDLAALCDEQRSLAASHVMSPEVVSATVAVNRAVGGRAPTAGDALAAGNAPSAPPPKRGSLKNAFLVPSAVFRFYPQMVEWVVEQVRRLVNDEGVAPAEIALIAPYVSDALRFSLQNGLHGHDIPSASHRPSRALRDEPAARCLLTLATLAHPDWAIRPPQLDVAQALTYAVDRLDPIRAALLAQAVYPPGASLIDLGPFSSVRSDGQQRITFAAGDVYDRLRDWLSRYRSGGELIPLDQFLARLFGEVLSQPGFGFHANFEAERVASQLVESARAFRWALEDAPQPGDPLPVTARLGRDYVRLVESGALGALYVPGWQPPPGAVTIAPAYTFLMRNRAVEVQVWLDIGSSGWWERLYQPLTHPYVLSQRWPAGRHWTDLDEYHARQDALRRLLIGLLRRTRRQVIVGISEIGESGFEQRGALLSLVNRILVQSEDPGSTGALPGSSADAAEEGFFGV
jgi:hypothetical protein